MRKAADILFLITTFSIRANFIEKATTYGKAAHTLFPGDPRIAEVYAFALLLKADFQAAEDLLTSWSEPTQNMAYLRCRTAILLNLPAEERRKRIESYLAFP